MTNREVCVGKWLLCLSLLPACGPVDPAEPALEEEIGEVAQAWSCGISTINTEPFKSHYGAGTASQNNGLTNHRGRVFQLRTTRLTELVQGEIASGYRSGDRVWVDVSLTQGRSWSQCGPYTRSQTNWISRPNGAWMRVCISADGISQCATNGNKRGPAGTAGGNLWWYDSDWTPY